MSMYASPAFQFDLVSALNLSANASDYAGSRDILGRYFSDPQLVTITDGMTALPNLSYWVAGKTVIVLSGGVREFAMWGLTLAGWSDKAKIQEASGYNSFAWKIALEHLNPVKLSGDPSTYKYVLVGTSLGGMVCHAFNQLQKRKSGKDADVIITVGAPRALATGFLGSYSEGEQYRFMNIGDPIPSFPPRLSEAPTLVPLAAGFSPPWKLVEYLTYSGGTSGPAAIALWPLFGHGPGGLVLTDLGYTWESVAPSPNAFLATSTPDPIQAIAGAAQVAQHQTAVYVENLRWREKNSRDKLLGEVGGAGEAGNWGFDVEPSFLLPVNVDGEFLLPLEGGFFPMSVNPIKTDTMPGPTGGRIGVLTLNGEIIAIYPTRSKAATAGRHLRRFLGRLPSANEVSLSGLMTGLTGYLNAAQRGRGVTRKAVVIGS